MRITILFGGTNKERLVSVATAQALHTALPEADLWFWAPDDAVHETSGKALLGHSRPFEDAFQPDGARIIGVRRDDRPVVRISEVRTSLPLNKSLLKPTGRKHRRLNSLSSKVLPASHCLVSPLNCQSRAETSWPAV